MGVAGTCYVAGPMRGYPEFNFPSFDSLALFMRRNGWTVFNPAEHDRDIYKDITEWAGYADGDISACPRFSLAMAMRWDLARITESHAIVLLPGWEQSSGARTELVVAEACNLEVLYAFPTNPFPAPDYRPEWFVSEVDIDRTGAV